MHCWLGCTERADSGCNALRADSGRDGFMGGVKFEGGNPEVLWASFLMFCGLLGHHNSPWFTDGGDGQKKATLTQTYACLVNTKYKTNVKSMLNVM